MLRALFSSLFDRLPPVRRRLQRKDRLLRELSEERERLRSEAALMRAALERLASPESVVERFHRHYYASRPWADNTFWLGIPTLKCPLDLWVYQEILCAHRPDLIVECGVRHGGSTLFLASICDLVGKGRVLAIDIEELPGRPCHARIEYLRGSSTSPEIIERVRARAGAGESVTVILDSDHSMTHVSEELRLYSEIVSPGSYLIVEDTNINGHPVCPEFGPGPKEAVERFLRQNPNFVVDERDQKFLLTFNPGGLLRRIR